MSEPLIANDAIVPGLYALVLGGLFYTRSLATLAAFIVLTSCSTANVSPSLDAFNKYDAEMDRLRKIPSVQDAFAFFIFEDDRNIRDLIELTEIPAPPFEETQRAARFAELLKEAGVEDIAIDEVGNVIGRKRGSSNGRAVAVVAHLDTVFPKDTEVTVRNDDNVYCAPGVGDNTRGIVTLLSIARAMNKFDLETAAEIYFIGSVGEEGIGDLRGVKHLFREGGPKIDSFVAVDGGDAGRIVNSAVGSYRYRIVFEGPGGHSWSAFGRVNPLHALGRAIELFTEKGEKIASTGNKTTYNVGRIGGGVSVNAIPAKAWFEVDIRSGNTDKLNSIDRALKRSVARAVAEENNKRSEGDILKVEFVTIGVRPTGSADPSSPLVNRAVAAAKAAGADPALKQASTDANIPMSLNVPAITIGRGGKNRNAHSPEECWENVNSHQALQSGLLLLLAEAGMR